MMNELLSENIELEKEFKDINLDGSGEFIKEMMWDLRWDLFASVQEDKTDYIVASSNEYAKAALKNQDKLIEALKKSETEFIKDMNGCDISIYDIKDNSVEYLNLGLQFFEEMID